MPEGPLRVASASPALHGLIDSHCHLDMLAGWGKREAPPTEAEVLAEADAAVARAREAGVAALVNPGASWGELDRVVAMGCRYPEVFIAAGIHPHDAATWAEGGADRLRPYVQHPKAVAVGECGLDYHYDLSPREAQQQAFRAQIRLARELGLPLIVHSREADDDTAAILEEEGAAEVGGVMHCFTSGRVLAERAMALGFCISFSGAVTFAKAEEVREVARHVPLDRVLVETDAPYLAPPPHRGKRNEPAFVGRIVEQLATLHGVAPQDVAEAAAANTRRVFRLPAAAR